MPGKYRTVSTAENRDKSPSRDPNVPHPGMTFICGCWRVNGAEVREKARLASRAYRERMKRSDPELFFARKRKSDAKSRSLRMTRPGEREKERQRHRDYYKNNPQALNQKRARNREYAQKKWDTDEEWREAAKEKHRAYLQQPHVRLEQQLRDMIRVRIPY